MNAKFPIAWKGLVGAGIVFTTLVCVFVVASLAQNQPTLVISSPSNGSVFGPGQTVTVTVQATGSFQAVTVFAQSPLQSDDVLGGPPYQFAISIPSTTSPGPYTVRAFGSVSPGNGVKSNPIVIRVESPKSVASLKPDVGRLAFDFVGEQLPVLVMGIFSDGTRADLSKSQGISYASTNTNIVTINS